MADPFLSEIRLFSFTFPPKGWALCNGQILPIAQNPGLFSLLKTTFGGDGQQTFALPDFRGRTPIHVGAGHTLGERGGEQTHVLTVEEMPTHVHTVNANAAVSASTNTPSPDVVLSQSSGSSLYGAAANLTAMAPNALADAGASQPHENMQPYLTLNFCIAIEGIYPPSD